MKSKNPWHKNIEARVTIISAICLMLTTVLVAVLTNERDVREVFVSTPDLDAINFIEYLGFQKNKVLKYKILERSTQDGKESEKIYIAEVKVLEIKNKKEIFLIELDNNLLFPLQEKEKQYLLIVSNLMYIISKDEESRVKEIFDKGNYILTDEDSQKQPDFILPFFDKQILPSPIPLYLRDDRMYLNHVEFEGSSNYFDGKKTLVRKIYRIYSQSLGDKSFSEFIPYLGFTHHSYYHEGSRLNYDIELLNTEK